MTKPCKYLTTNEIADTEYSFFSVTYEADELKRYWVINLYGEAQILLADENDRPCKFDTEQDALVFCEKTWPSLTALPRPSRNNP